MQTSHNYAIALSCECASESYHIVSYCINANESYAIALYCRVCASESDHIVCYCVNANESYAIALYCQCKRVRSYCIVLYKCKRVICYCVVLSCMCKRVSQSVTAPHLGPVDWAKNTNLLTYCISATEWLTVCGHACDLCPSLTLVCNASGCRCVVHISQSWHVPLVL